METFAQRLRRLRLARNLTQEQLAHACGYPSQSRIAGYESQGKFMRTPPVTEVPVLAKALGVPESELFAAMPELTTNDLQEPDSTELQLLLSMTAQALAASTPIAGRELVAAVRKRLPVRKGTFVGDFVAALEDELSDIAGTFPRKHSGRGSR